MKNDFFTENRSKIMIGLLVISLVANIFLFAMVNSAEFKIRHSASSNYTAFFSTLRFYSDSMDYLANEDLQIPGDGEREMQTLYVQSFNLLEHARSYRMLSDEKDELSRLIWNLAIHLSDTTHRLSEDDIKNNRAHFKEFSRTLREIVELENTTRFEMTSSNDGFVEEELHTVLKPIVEKSMDLQLSNE